MTATQIVKDTACEIELSTQEPGGCERKGFPLTVGIPFAEGILDPSDPVVIEDDAGRVLPLQTRVLETHDDASVRWLLLDFQADLKPFRRSGQKLIHGLESCPTPEYRKIHTHEKSERLTFDNGPLTLDVDCSRCAPLSRVALDGETLSDGGLEFEITAPDGTAYRASHDPDVKFEVEESGPLRQQVRWEGTHQDDRGRGHFDFLVRLTVYANQPFVRVDHTFINRLDEQDTAVRRVSARLPLGLRDASSFAVGTYARGPASFCADKPLRLEQLHFAQFRVLDHAGAVLHESDNNHAIGWINVSGSNHGVLLSPKAFWQNHPKAVSADSSGIEFDLIPRRDEDFAVPRGMAKTHTFFLTFHQGATDPQALADLALAVQRWPMPAANSRHYIDSGQFWEVFEYLPKKYPRLERSIRNIFEPDQSHRRGPRSLQDLRRGRSFGLKNYGDLVIPQSGGGFSYPGRAEQGALSDFHLNNEYDAVHILLTFFLHNRDITTWWGVEAHALHQMDIDTCHHAVADQIPPGLDLDCVLKCEWYQSPQHTGSPGTSILTYAEGLISCYHLTGDRRYLDTAVGYGDYIAHLHEYYPWDLGRGSGWALQTLGSVYPLCAKKEYRTAAEAMLNRIQDRFDELGQSFAASYHPRGMEDRRITLTVRGLIKWEWATGDKRFKDMILKMMRAYLDVAFLDEGLPMESNVPELARACTPDGNGCAHMESLAYAYRATGDRRFIEAGMGFLADWSQWINTPQVKEAKKCFMRGVRGMFPFIAAAHELGLLEKVPAAGAWVTD